MSVIKGTGAGDQPSTGFYSHTIDQSLRFEDGDSASLTRTPGSASNQKTWTWSSWIKRGNLGTIQTIFSGGTGGSLSVEIQFGSDNTIRMLDTNNTYLFITNALFRDVSSWYHIVIENDTTQSTVNNRTKLYVNGTQITSFSTDNRSNFAEDEDTGINSANAHYIGRWINGGQLFDGYMAEVNFVDGTALTAASFGETKDGIWVPKDASGLTFGTNGFYLPFAVTQGNSAFFDASGDDVTFTHATHYDIAADEDFTLELYFNTSDVDDYGDFVSDYNASYFLMSYDFRTEKDIQFYTGNGAAFKWTAADNGDVVANTWHHVAITRTGEILRCFLDGVRLTTLVDAASNTGFTVSSGNVTDFGDKSYNNGALQIGNKFKAFGPGFISNFRLVIGTSVYNSDSNFTVSTSALTNITNTELLAFTTGSVIKDSSDNNVTGSVTGDVRFDSNTPFSAILGKDASSNTNNFAATGVAFSDVVLDSPSGNFATLNSLRINKQTQVFAEGNLKFSSSQSSTNPACVSTFAVNSGKWYWEVLVVTAANASNSVGIATTTGNLEDDQYAGYQKDWAFSYQTDGNKRNNNSASSYGSSFTDGDIIAVMLDLDNGNLYFRKNNTIQASGAAAFSSLSDTFTSYSLVYSGGAQVYNFGQDSSFVGAKAAQGNTDGNGVGNFFYAPPSGYLALASSNLPDITIGPGKSSQADDFFDIILWTGNGTNAGDQQEIDGLSFTPDLVWTKGINAARYNELHDSVRGATKRIFSNETAAESDVESIKTFDSDGFTVAIGTGGQNGTNANTTTHVGWCWKAGTAASGTESGNNPAFSSSSNATAGFSIVSYTGTGAVGTVSHGCGAVPKLIICKNRDATDNWAVYHSETASDAETDYLILNTNGAVADSADWWNDTAPTNSVFTVATDHSVNADGEKYIAYCFSEIVGYSKITSYTGNGSATKGTYVNLGFRPAFLFMKKPAGSAWTIIDSKQNPTNLSTTTRLRADDPAVTDTAIHLDILSNGFKMYDTDLNADGALHIVYAIAETPFKFANAR